jgi:hypothetical protein
LRGADPRFTQTKKAAARYCAGRRLVELQALAVEAALAALLTTLARLVLATLLLLTGLVLPALLLLAGLVLSTLLRVLRIILLMLGVVLFVGHENALRHCGD